MESSQKWFDDVIVCNTNKTGPLDTNGLGSQLPNLIDAKPQKPDLGG
jgi:hypothetical protein